MNTLETESEVVEKCEPKIETAAAKESPHQAYYLLPKNGVVYTCVHNSVPACTQLYTHVYTTSL